MVGRGRTRYCQQPKLPTARRHRGVKCHTLGADPKGEARVFNIAAGEDTNLCFDRGPDRKPGIGAVRGLSG